MISIIVPVYNSEKYLAETLNSICSQSFCDIEIVCVNDGSTDSSLSILKEWRNTDGRIVVINQENSGVSLARNAGIEAARGDILMFVDADDCLTPDACEVVSRIFEEEQCDVLTFGMRVDPPEAAPIILRREMIPANKVFEGFTSDLLFKEYSRPYACRSAVRTSLLKEHAIGFEPGVKLGEDQIFLFDVYPWSKKTVLLSKALYVYKMRDESATHTITATSDQIVEKLNQHFAVVKAIFKHWKNWDFQTNFCGEELLEWVMDFLTLDINKLSQDKQAVFYRRLLDLFDWYFEKPENFAARRPAKALLDNMRVAAAGKGSISKLNIVRYYYMRRGFRKCVERVLLKAKSAG